MLKDQNNPKVLSAIADVVKNNRIGAVKETTKVSEALSSRYSSFRPVTAQAKPKAELVESKQEVAEKLHPNQQVLDVHEPEKDELTSADFKKLRSLKKFKKKSDVKEQSEVIDEARGRPRKNPAADDDGKEPDQHIHVQLSKASDMTDSETKGGADVKFDNGSHFVHAAHAKKVLSALDKLKPSDREKMHSHIQQSHANFMAVHKLVS
jgi:hypothetical protein